MAGEQEESRRKIGAVTIRALRWPDMFLQVSSFSTDWPALDVREWQTGAGWDKEPVPVSHPAPV